MKTYKTSEVAHLIGIHPNTVRLYETLELIPKPKRQKNGYRIFNDYHIEQFKLARTAFKIEIMQNDLRKKIIQVVKTSAKGDFDTALILANEYLVQVRVEMERAKEAIVIVNEILSNKRQKNVLRMKRKEVSAYLNISIDTLRNWELNGLLKIKRKDNGYRVYTEDDVDNLIIIRALRGANFSLASILRMLNTLPKENNMNIEELLDTPKQTEEIVTACDQLITSLECADENVMRIIETLKDMKLKFSNPPL